MAFAAGGACGRHPLVWQTPQSVSPVELPPTPTPRKQVRLSPVERTKQRSRRVVPGKSEQHTGSIQTVTDLIGSLPAKPKKAWNLRDDDDNLAGLRDLDCLAIRYPPGEQLDALGVIASDLASKYVGQLDRLSENQRMWRQKHDALVRRKKNQKLEASTEGSDCSRTKRPSASEPGSRASSRPTSQGQRGRGHNPRWQDRAAYLRKALMAQSKDKDKAKGDDAPAPPKVNRRNSIFQASSWEGEDTLPQPKMNRRGGDTLQPKKGRGVYQSPAWEGGDLPQMKKGRRASVFQASMREGMMPGAESSQGNHSRMGKRTLTITSEELAGSEKDAPVIDLPRPRLLAVQPASSDRAAPMSNFEMCIYLARKHNLHIHDVRRKLEEFAELDLNGDKELSFQEFEDAIRKRCNLPEDEPIPEHLVQRQFQELDCDGDGSINVEEFLLWSTNHAFTEEMLVTDPKERQFRQLARDHGFCLPDVEKVKTVFDKFDQDGSGYIDEDEFRQALIQLWGVKDSSDLSKTKMRQYWVEVDADASGQIAFAEFVTWYLNVFMSS